MKSSETLKKIPWKVNYSNYKEDQCTVQLLSNLYVTYHWENKPFIIIIIIINIIIIIAIARNNNIRKNDMLASIMEELSEMKEGVREHSIKH